MKDYIWSFFQEEFSAMVKGESCYHCNTDSKLDVIYMQGKFYWTCSTCGDSCITEE